MDELTDSLKVCNCCGKDLNTDEKIINARFIQQASANNQDISVFPVCVNCNFDNLLSGSYQARLKQLDENNLKVKVPTAKKF